MMVHKVSMATEGALRRQWLTLAIDRSSALAKAYPLMFSTTDGGMLLPDSLKGKRERVVGGERFRKR